MKPFIVFTAEDLAEILPCYSSIGRGRIAANLNAVLNSKGKRVYAPESGGFLRTQTLGTLWFTTER